MRKPITMACLFLLLLVVLTGCWNRRELNELAIAVAMGVDKKDNDYLVSIQIVNPGAVAAQRAGTDTAPVITYSTQGTSIFEALRRTTTKSPRKIYLSHMQVIVLGKEVAEEGINAIRT
ncbi:Ger(x)C family spore germination protein [Brevibacillus sp. FSL L8-0710]|uniref:Ger(x)C family spore germination protein n=1 Tax=Brevibacillus sp. FSL L8-0710 TaxID=2975313 RepID=UPI0030F9571E